jgi:hypothetical protein
MDDAAGAEQIVALLAGGDRLRVVAALVLGACSLAELAEATDLPSSKVGRAVTRLVRGGLVEEDNHGYRLREELLRSLARSQAQAEPGSGVAGEGDEPASAALRAFVREGRLVSIPSSHGKRLQVLDLIAQDFEIGVRYSEKRVNEMLCRWHPDYAALRRYLVDDGFLDRHGGGGSYWRTGGTVKD